MYKRDLALNNLKQLIYHKAQRIPLCIDIIYDILPKGKVMESSVSNK